MMEAPRTSTFRVLLVSAALITALPVIADGAIAGTLERIRAAETIRIAYLPFSPPFSYKDPNSSEPKGFTIDLCRAVAKKLAGQIGLSSLKPVYVLATAQNRLEMIKSGNADLLCEGTSDTLTRREIVDFSVPIFVDGASFMTNDAALDTVSLLGGHKVGVLSGTTTEKVLRTLLDGLGTAAEVVPAKTHEEGLETLESGQTSAYFADHAILRFLVKTFAKHPEKLHVSSQYLTVEPDALALPPGDDQFRLAVDTALSQIFRSDEIDKLYSHYFAVPMKQNELMRALYLISALPD